MNKNEEVEIETKTDVSIQPADELQASIGEEESIETTIHDDFSQDKNNEKENDGSGLTDRDIDLERSLEKTNQDEANNNDEKIEKNLDTLEKIAENKESFDEKLPSENKPDQKQDDEEEKTIKDKQTTDELDELGKNFFNLLFEKYREKNAYIRNSFLQTVAELCDCGIKDIDYDAVFLFARDRAHRDLLQFLEESDEPLVDLLSEKKIAQLASVLGNRLEKNRNIDDSKKNLNEGRAQNGKYKKTIAIKDSDQKMLQRIL